jgi:hypothetical protein
LVEVESIENMSATFIYWKNLLETATNLPWIFIYERNKGFKIKINANEVLSANSGLSSLYDKFEYMRKQCILSTKGFNTIDVIFWEIHKRLLKVFTSMALDNVELFIDLDYTTRFHNIFIKSSTTESHNNNKVTDLAIQEFKSNNLDLISIPDFSINTNQRLIRYQMDSQKTHDDLILNVLINTFELIRDAKCLENILNHSGCYLRKKNEYYDERAYAFANEAATDIYKLYEIAKFHVFHYFSRFSFNAQLDFAPVKELLTASIERSDSNLKLEAKRKNAKKLRSMKTAYNKRRYKEEKIAAAEKISIEADKDFAAINLPTDSYDNNYLTNEILDTPIDEVGSLKVDFEKDKQIQAQIENDVSDYSIPSTNQINQLTDISQILLHKKNQAIAKTISNNNSGSKITWVTKSFEFSTAEKDLLKILNSLKSPVSEMATVDDFAVKTYNMSTAVSVGARR